MELEAKLIRPLSCEDACLMVAELLWTGMDRVITLQSCVCVRNYSPKWLPNSTESSQGLLVRDSLCKRGVVIQIHYGEPHSHASTQ